MQKQISRMNRRVASVALAFAIVLVPAVIAIRSAQAQTFVVLYSFANGADGASPQASLILDSQGNLYGTTAGGGGGGGAGTVFKVDATGNETVLYRFTGTGGDGLSPLGNLVRDGQGNLYGATSSGGFACTLLSFGCGTVFKVDLTGNETVLYSFTVTGVDGASPDAGWVLDAQGNLYGTAFLGGDLTCKLSAFGCGTVFKVD